METSTGSASLELRANLAWRCHHGTRESGDGAVAGNEGNLVRGRPHAGLYRRDFHRARGRRPDRGAASDRADIRAGRHHRPRRADPSCRRSFHIHRTAEPVSGSDARWRTPFVLCSRSRSRPADVRACTGNGLPNSGSAWCLMLMVFATYNDILHLAGSKSARSGVADGQRLGIKLELHCERPFAAPAKLATSVATNGILPVRRGMGRHRNDKGALRMNAGMRVLRGVCSPP